MVKEYKAPRAFNRIMTLLARIGIGSIVELVTTGRKTGRPRSVPISPITREGTEYLVAPYGSVDWVQNLRAHPRATLRKGSKSRTVDLVEVTDDSPEIVAAYYERERYSRPYMDVPAAPTVEDFRKARGLFPVFRIEG